MPSVVSQKNVAKAVRYILVQLSSLQVSGRWLLAAGLLSLVTGHWLPVSASASSKKPVARSLKKTCFVIK